MRESAESLQLLVTLYDTIEKPDLQEALYLTVIKGMTVKEAANVAGVSVFAMTRRKERGRTLLRERYEDACGR
jgi:DNA-directed RNA polymerase specialized sigma24 family protein